MKSRTPCCCPAIRDGAEAIAERYLDDTSCYNRVRNMLGFTGTYRGRRISVQGSGMGMPSIAIYATELMRFYGVRTVIRVGSCGAMQDHVGLRDLVVATAAHTDSAMNRRQFHGIDFAAAADVDLVVTAARLAASAACPPTSAPSCRPTRSTTPTRR